MSLTGSSPRPWGTLSAVACTAALGRFIPTPVGNTASDGPEFGRISVHPHARGEHRRDWYELAAVAGSSPRPWGTLRGDPVVRLGGRFIPTPVGNTERRPALGWP